MGTEGFVNVGLGFVKIYLARDADGKFRRLYADSQREASSQVSMRTVVRTFTVKQLFVCNIEAFGGFIRQSILRFIWEEESYTIEALISSAKEEIEKMCALIRELKTLEPTGNDSITSCDHAFIEDEYGIVECEECGAYDVISRIAMSIVTARHRSKSWDETKDRLTVVKECNHLKVSFTEELLTATTTTAARLMANG